MSEKQQFFVLHKRRREEKGAASLWWSKKHPVKFKRNFRCGNTPSSEGPPVYGPGTVPVPGEIPPFSCREHVP